MIGLFRLLRGVDEWECTAADAALLIGAMMARSIYFYGLKTVGERVVFRAFCTARREIRALGERVTSLRLHRSMGLPPLVHRYRRRIGIPLGAAVCLFLLLFSEKFIWSVDVSGSETLHDAEVIGLLARVGVEVGSYLPSIDLWDKCGEALRLEPRLSFLSVNMEGTAAHIVVKESTGKQPSDWLPRDDAAPSNLVASRAGRITGYEISSGQLVKKTGMTVSEGEILVSGIVNTKRYPDDTFRLERAVGRVWAETVRQITVTLPLETEERRETGRTLLEKNVIFFGKSIKLFKNSGNLPARYVIIEEKDRWVLFGGEGGPLPSLPLPVFTVRTYAAKEETVTVRRTEEEAKALAWKEFRLRYEEEMRGKELLSLRTEEGPTEDGSAYRVRAFVGCLENIAAEVPITFDEIGG